MIEIAVLFFLGRRIAQVAKEKGHAPGGLVGLFIALWFAGELTGAALGYEIANRNWFHSEAMTVTYLAALAGAAIGSAIMFIVMNTLTDRRARIRKQGQQMAATAAPAIPIPPATGRGTRPRS